MLNVQFNVDDMMDVADKLGASPKQVRFAFTRALKRTAGTLRKMSRKGLKSELELRNLARLRKRIGKLRFAKRARDFSEATIWYGTNDLAMSSFKGRPKKNRRGVSFRGVQYDGAFVAKYKHSRYRTAYKRVGKKRFPIVEQQVPVKDKMNIFLEDEIFDKVDEIFMKHFRKDLYARTVYGVGQR